MKRNLLKRVFCILMVVVSVISSGMAIADGGTRPLGLQLNNSNIDWAIAGTETDPYITNRTAYQAMYMDSENSISVLYVSMMLDGSGLGFLLSVGESGKFVTWNPNQPVSVYLQTAEGTQAYSASILEDVMVFLQSGAADRFAGDMMGSRNDTVVEIQFEGSGVVIDFSLPHDGNFADVVARYNQMVGGGSASSGGGSATSDSITPEFRQTIDAYHADLRQKAIDLEHTYADGLTGYWDLAKLGLELMTEYYEFKDYGENNARTEADAEYYNECYMDLWVYFSGSVIGTFMNNF